MKYQCILQHGWNLKTLYKIHSQKIVYCIIPFLGNVQNKQIFSDKQSIRDCQAMEGSGMGNDCSWAWSFFLVWWNKCSTILLWWRLQTLYGNVAGGPVAKTSPSHAASAGLILGWGAKIPQALGPKIQNIKQKQYCNNSIKILKNGPH